MIATPIKTDVITPGSIELTTLLDKYVPTIREKSIVAITSKVVSLCENRVVKIGLEDKEQLIIREADYYLPPNNPYGISLTIKDHILIPTAGIDESNGNGYYILWPEDSQRSANTLRRYLAQKYRLKHIGVIIVDSKTTALRKGTTGITLAHSGFAALQNYIGRPDIFGQPLSVTKANLADGIAAAAVLVMGEGNEQTPLALIESVPSIVYQDRNPTVAELAELRIDIKDDLYAELLNNAPWQTKNTA